jgi:hypothetical protein
MTESKSDRFTVMDSTAGERVAETLAWPALDDDDQLTDGAGEQGLGPRLLRGAG